MTQAVENRIPGKQNKGQLVAFIISNASYFGPYQVESICDRGALLYGRYLPREEESLQCMLLAPSCRQVRLGVRVIYKEYRGNGDFYLALVFDQTISWARLVCEAHLESMPEAPLEFSQPTILVVDDCIEVCHALQRDLRALGRRAIYSLTPIDAITKLMDPQIRIESVVVDLFLGQADGLEILRFLSVHYPQVRRVLISGQVRSTQLKLAQSSGQAHAVIEKPWSRDSLVEALLLEPPG